jgi:ubiquitin-protein ligase
MYRLLQIKRRMAFINQNNNIQNTIVPPSARPKKQRLFSEIEFLETNYQEVNIIMIHNKEVSVHAKYPLQNMPKEIKIILSNDYPFKPPEVYIRGTNYLHTIHNCHLPRIKRLVQKYATRVLYKSLMHFSAPNAQSTHGIICREKSSDFIGQSTNSVNCLKCMSILLHDLWSPAMQFKNIFDEIEKTNQLKRKIKYEIALEDIFKVYQQLPDDLLPVIRSYLYH